MSCQQAIPDLCLFNATTRPLPLLDPGLLPATYIEMDSNQAGPSKLRDLDAEQVEKSSSKLKAPHVTRIVPELSKSGKPLTKKEKKAVCSFLSHLSVVLTPL